jgi:hypothetical protein
MDIFQDLTSSVTFQFHSLGDGLFRPVSVPWKWSPSDGTFMRAFQVRYVPDVSVAK